MYTETTALSLQGITAASLSKHKQNRKTQKRVRRHGSPLRRTHVGFNIGNSSVGFWAVWEPRLLRFKLTEFFCQRKLDYLICWMKCVVNITGVVVKNEKKNWAQKLLPKFFSKRTKGKKLKYKSSTKSIRWNLKSMRILVPNKRERVCFCFHAVVKTNVRRLCFRKSLSLRMTWSITSRDFSTDLSKVPEKKNWWTKYVQLEMEARHCRAFCLIN